MKSQAKRWSVWVGLIVAVWALGSTLHGQKLVARPFMAGGQPGPGGSVNLPYMANDGKGQMWRVYQGGYLQNQGPTPNGGNTSTFSQGAMILLNGANFNQQNNQGKVDEKTGELLIENMQGQGCTVTRRIFVNKDDGYVRYIDVIKSTQAQDQQVQLMISTNLNYGINTSQTLDDPKKKGQQIGWAAQTGSMACLYEMYAGKGSKVTPTIMAQPGNSVCQATYNVTIPGNKEIAIMHLHGMSGSQEAGLQWMTGLKESKLLRTIPAALRKLIVNFAGGQNFIGDFEVLRGDLLDVVEIKGGDVLKGTLKEPEFEIATFYGPVTLPVDRVIGVLNVGQFRPRQLVVTVDGQVYGGKLKKETVDLQLSSGQVTQVPLSQISRVGYRKRAGEPEEWTFEKPIVLMRSGERVGVKMPTTPVEFATRYGKVTLKPEQIAAILLQSDEAGLHQVLLTDGGKFSGLVAADKMEVTLDSGAGSEAKTVSFPVSSVARFQFTPKIAEAEEFTPTLNLANEDMLVGTVGGQLKVETAFDVITVNAAEIRALSRVKESATDVQIVLFDGSTLSGQLQQLELDVKTTGGLSLKVPLALLEEYQQPQPAPSKDMTDKIKKLVEELNDKDWKKRDRAADTLKGMGPVAISVLKQMRADQPPETQRAFEEILKDLEKQAKEKAKPAGGTGNAPAPGGGPVPIPFVPQQQGIILDQFIEG